MSEEQQTEEIAERAAKSLESLAASFRDGSARPIDLETVAETREGVTSDGLWLTLEPTGVVVLRLRYQRQPAGGGK